MAEVGGLELIEASYEDKSEYKKLLWPKNNDKFAKVNATE
jgi:hypothetical protein